MVSDKILLADGVEKEDRLFVTTMPHYAGPAAVQVTNASGLEDTVIGGFRYVDLLQISYVTPAVVRVKQSGVNDIVDIIGYGFYSGLTLKAYPSGRPELAVSTTVDDDRLRLYSAQKMSWVVADLGGKYRGFVDLEISDTLGRHFILPNALFMGQLGVERTLQTRDPWNVKDLQEEIARAAAGLPSAHVLDPLQLPPGKIVGLESDTSLNLIYVLGAPLTVFDGPSPENITSESDLRHFVTPGWISLVHYERDHLGNAAPMLGLGYYDLPQDLAPSAIVLGEQHVYVSAEGYKFPFIKTPD
jgi:hypothetical protein